MDRNFWIGLLIGFPVGIVASILASGIWELLARRHAHRAAIGLVGEWCAYDLEGRALSQTPMKGAGPTVISLKSRWWSADAGVLDFDSFDIDDTGKKRYHDGRIVMDTRVPWLARRIDRYRDSHEVAQQDLILSRDPSVVYVFPIAGGSTLGGVYRPHAWRKTAP